MKSLFAKTIFALASLVFAGCAFAQPVKYLMTGPGALNGREILTLNYNQTGYTATTALGEQLSLNTTNGVTTMEMFGVSFKIPTGQYYYHSKIGQTRTSPIMVRNPFNNLDTQVGTDSVTYIGNVPEGKKYSTNTQIVGKLSMWSTDIISPDGKIHSSIGGSNLDGNTNTLKRLP